MDEKSTVPEDNTSTIEDKVKDTASTEFEKTCIFIAENGHQYHKTVHDLGGTDPKEYHNLGHIYTVEDRAKLLPPIFKLSADQQAEMLMAIAWHDSVINYDLPDSNNIVAMIKRHGGATEQDTPYGLQGNEAKSFELLNTRMLQFNFSQESLDTVKSIISATYSKADLGTDFQGAIFSDYAFYKIALSQNPKLAETIQFLNSNGIDRGLHISQPYFEEMLDQGVEPQVLITALSDLGDVGTAEKEMFFRNGDAEMRELFYNINQPGTLQRLINGATEQDKKDRSQVVDTFIKWQKTEVGFAVWQALRFEKTIYLLNQHKIIDSEQETALRGVFNHFTDNIIACYRRLIDVQQTYTKYVEQDEEQQAFLNLLETLHYRIPSSDVD